MKDIRTLPDDIYGVLQSVPKNEDGVPESLATYGGRAAVAMHRALRARLVERTPMTIFASELGKRCWRQVWYAHNAPELVEPLQAKTKFKFLYGDLIEEAVLTLAEEAGHEVTQRQTVREYKVPNGWTVRGRIDAMIDGVLVDVKSSTSYGMKKFEAGLDDGNDSFGYRQQLSFYNGVHVAATEQVILGVDKQNGEIGVFPVEWVPLGGHILALSETLEFPNEPNKLHHATEEAPFKNTKLGVECGYCPFKRVCWRDANKGAGLMRLGYASGPVWLTSINKMPAVSAIPEPAPFATDEVLTKVKERNK